MRQEKIQYFTEKEEEFVNLLIEIGMKKIVAKVLVFFAGTPEATSRDVERGADMRQPEVSTALNYMMEQGWIISRDIPSENKGRPKKVYNLTKPITDIIDSIGKEKMKEATTQLAMIQKLRDFIH